MVAIEMVNDVRLNRQFLETGDIDAFTRLFKKYYPTVYAYVDRMMQDHTDPAVDADDITSETFTKAFDKRKEIQEPEKLLRWLLKAAKNLTIDRIRKSRQQAKYLSVESLDNLSVRQRETLSASILAERNTEQTQANQYLMKQLLRLLSDKDREIVEFILEGLFRKEIAEKIDSTPDAVQKRWERFTAWLRPIGLHLDALVDCLPEEDERKIMEQYLDGQPLSDIAKANGISCSDVDKCVKHMIRQWKKAVKQNPADPVVAMTNNEG